MNMLFAIQATGNGHISRAREVIPHLLQYGNVDVLISGTQADVQLPYLIKYKKRGLSYTFGKHGGIDLIDTIKQLRPFHFFSDVLQFPVNNYDLIINDFEPVTAWAARLKNKPCIALSHQSAYLSQHCPRPAQKDAFAEQVFRHYAPTSHQIGFHFKAYDSFIHTPVIRSEVRKLMPEHQEHITVYLPAHSDSILIKHLNNIPEVEWQVFSKHSKQAYRDGAVFIKPISNESFTQSLAKGNGLITAGGFESPAEALYLGKKVLSIPMSNQYEQLCNAEAMKDIGVSVVSKIDAFFVPKLRTWLTYGKAPVVNYPDETESIIEQLVMSHAQQYNLAI